MEPRREELLQLVIEKHIATAEPVGSRFLVDEVGFDWSEATVRNELRALEEEGFLTHPHTSAGRIPTEKGYRYYLDKIDWSKTTQGKREAAIIDAASDGILDKEMLGKNMAKAVSGLSGELAIIAFTPDKFYYTGLSHLFSKPEFGELSHVAKLSQVFDHCEESIAKFYKVITTTPTIYVGNEQPFGAILSSLSFSFNEGKSLFALLGPMRMDYKRNFGLLKKIATIL